VTRIPALRLVACADPDAAAAVRVAAVGHDVRTYPSIEVLLGGSDVDAILVATPHHMLCPASLAAISAGKHVMAEKPCGLNAEEAAAIEAAAARAGVRYMVGYSCRFSLARAVHELIAAGTVGELQAMSGVFGCDPLNEGWMASKESGGGPLLYLGSHLVDMLLWFICDDPVEVSGSIRCRPDTGLDDTAAFQIRFARGALAQGLVTQAAPAFYFTMDIHGRDGRITLRGWTFVQYEIEVLSTLNPAYAQPTVIRPLSWTGHLESMLVPELEEFALAIEEARAPAITATDGRRVLQVLDAVVAADRRGSRIMIG
jgi:predicted dehydrogenase